MLVNLVGYQLVWLISVYGAGAGHSWPALASAAVFALSQLTLFPTRGADATLIAVAVLFGLLLDGILARAHLLTYAAAAPAVPEGAAPLWILALWLAFALTVNHSLRLLVSTPLRAALAGLLGGPLAYLAAARIHGAIQFSTPAWRPLCALALGWGAAMSLLGYLARRGARVPRRAAADALI
jgi:hypothetical protein